MASEDGFYARPFQRHAHPFSAWSKLSSTPLLFVPLWTRRRWLYVPIATWFAVNPVLTPRAHDTSSSATRAILGEESWTSDPTSEPMVLALYQHRKTGAVAGTGIFVALTLWQWKPWADRFTRETRRTAA